MLSSSSAALASRLGGLSYGGLRILTTEVPLYELRGLLRENFTSTPENGPGRTLQAASERAARRMTTSDMKMAMMKKVMPATSEGGLKSFI